MFTVIESHKLVLLRNNFELLQQNLKPQDVGHDLVYNPYLCSSSCKALCLCTWTDKDLSK